MQKILKFKLFPNMVYKKYKLLSQSIFEVLKYPRNLLILANPSGLLNETKDHIEHRDFPYWRFIAFSLDFPANTACSLHFNNRKPEAGARTERDAGAEMAMPRDYRRRLP